MIKNISINPWDFATAIVSETHGGQQLNLTFDNRLVDDLLWLRDHRAKMEQEAKLRQENEALNSAWEQYQTVLNLVILDN